MLRRTRACEIGDQWDAEILRLEVPANYVIIVLGLIVGLGVWFVPNKWAEPESVAAWQSRWS
jgi:hypothetical protein